MAVHCHPAKNYDLGDPAFFGLVMSFYDLHDYIRISHRRPLTVIMHSV